MKEIILIGGYFHRKKMEIKANETIIKMALPAKYDIPNLGSSPSCQSIEVQTYGRVVSIYGMEKIFPDHMFLHTEIDPVIFLRDLVSDYL